MEAYKQLEAQSLNVYRLSHLLRLGEWDARVMMPKKGAAARGQAIGALMEHIHGVVTSPESKALIDAAMAGKDALNLEQQANLREINRRYVDQSAVPKDLVRRKAALGAASQVKWAECRAKNDFQAFLPTLQKMVELSREEARLRSAATGKGLYESLFNMYEPGMSLATLEGVFADLRSWLPQLLRDIQESRKSIDASIIPIDLEEFPRDKQEALNRRIMTVMGFDFEGGRLDVSASAFTGMVKEDSRITTNYDLQDYKRSMFATIHETGHSKYETHIGPKAMDGQLVCQFRSLGVHESQSRFQEVIVGRSGAYSTFLTPLLKEYFGDQKAFTEENIRKLHQKVEPGFIRIRADEVCYPLHVLIRFEIERALIEGEMEVADVPAAWNEKMKTYLGLDTTGRDDIGCLQDTHWCKGYIGYFPTYALGSIFAAQLMASIKKELGEDVVEKCIRTGDFGPIFAKQEEKIWSQGCLYETEELMKKATGEPLNAKYFREHLERRYLRNED